MNMIKELVMSARLPVRLWVAFLCFSIAADVMAQDPAIDEPEGLEEEVIINKDLKLELPPAQRNFEKVPPDTEVGSSSEDIQYEYQEFELDIQSLPARLRVLKLKEEKPKKYSGNYFTLGFGNYLTPYIAAGLNSSNNKQGLYGLNLEHISSRYGPVDQENSGDAHSSIGLMGKYIGGKASIGGDLAYNRDMVHFYGYPEGETVDRDTIRQVFNRIGLNMDIEGVDVESPVQYRFYGDVKYIQDRYDVSEVGILTGFTADYKLDPHFSAGLDIDLAFFDYDNLTQDFRSLVKASPKFDYVVGDIHILAGIRIGYLSDTLNYKNDTRIYPRLGLSYTINDDFTAYADLDGDMEVVSFDKLAAENPYINRGVPAVHRSKRYELTAGLRGQVLNQLNFDAGVKIGTYKNMHFFLNDSVETNKFNVIYDGGNTVWARPFLSLSLDKPDLYALSWHIQYNFYNTGDLPVAWHKPAFEMLLSGWYSIYSKVRLGAELFTVSGMTGLDPTVSTDYFSETGKQKLESIVDLNFKADYIFSERYRLFIQLNNIFNKKYNYFLQYPNRGLQAMVGISIDF
jgi:hypothetical protein